MKEPVHLFLGANSAQGFYSLYDQLLSGRFDDLLILKGGPGCGKSTFMRHLAAAATEAGVESVYIHCSGDPDSLDGVIFPALRAAAVDGTSPHALEPSYAVACERCVDLTRFYDVAGVKKQRAELMALSDAYRAHYRGAYHVLRALDAVESERRRVIHAKMDWTKLEKRTQGILQRELHGREAPGGRVFYAFLGGVTHRGELCRYDTAQALCPRVIELCDESGLGDGLLHAALRTAEKQGARVLACPNPSRPKELHHLLLPERGLAFVTATGGTYLGAKPYRRIRLDAMAELTRAEKAKQRFFRRMEHSLLDEAAEQLTQAKVTHDTLERLYHPFIDFGAVFALAAQEAQRLFGVTQ